MMILVAVVVLGPALKRDLVDPQLSVVDGHHMGNGVLVQSDVALEL